MTAFWMTTRKAVDAPDQSPDYGVVAEQAGSTVVDLDDRNDYADDTEIELADLLGLNVSVFGDESGYIQSICNTELMRSAPVNDNAQADTDDEEQELRGYATSQFDADDEDYGALKHWLPSAWRLWL